MKWRRIIPGCLTLGILFFGFKSVLSTIAGDYVLAAQWIVLAAILDGLDGEVARMFRGVTTFGAKLDTYVDCITFGFVPAVMVYQAVWCEMGVWGTVFAAGMMFSGAIRFARYQYKESRIGQHSFRGLPIPVCAIWVSMIVLLTESPMLADGRFPIDKGSVAVVMWVLAIAFLLLQVSNVRYVKPTKELIGWGLAGTFALMAIMGKPVLVFCLSSCVAIAFYAVVMPFLTMRQVTVEEEEEEEAPVELRR